MDRNHDRKANCDQKGVTRRGFLKSVGVGAAVLTASSNLSAFARSESEVIQAGKMARVNLSVNGRRHALLVEPRWSLLYVLREKLGLTATKVGCERGECGACTVLVDHVPRYACMILAVEAEGNEITTLEGLMEGEALGTVQRAFVEEDAFQCGYCTPGQVMSVEGLLQVKDDPSLEEIRRAVSGNLCRCGAYAHIFRAVRRAAEIRRGG
jgi:xanthine dehydrogenase YagT iron-sulfur-binding subunit